MSDPMWIPVWLAVVAIVGQILNTLVNLWVAKLSQQNASQIALLEKNTNSMKDQLVKIVGEAEHAKGTLEGIAQEKGRIAETVTITEAKAHEVPLSDVLDKAYVKLPEKTKPKP